MDSLEFHMRMTERAYRRYEQALEQARFWDLVESLYEKWDADIKRYWSRFSNAYKQGSEFYFEELPLEAFWLVFFCLVASWLENQVSIEMKVD